MDHWRPLFGYPCALLYGVFALLTIFWGGPCDRRLPRGAVAVAAQCCWRLMRIAQYRRWRTVPLQQLAWCSTMIWTIAARSDLSSFPADGGVTEPRRSADTGAAAWRCSRCSLGRRRPPPVCFCFCFIFSVFKLSVLLPWSLHIFSLTSLVALPKHLPNNNTNNSVF